MNSLYFHSARIALNHDQCGASANDPVAHTCRQYCIPSSQEIICLVRHYRNTYGLRHAPLTLVYAVVRAIRSIKLLGIPEEHKYLLQALSECSPAWDLADQIPAAEIATR